MKECQLRFAGQFEPLFLPELPVRYFIVTGGRASGKSFAVSSWACLELLNAPPGKNVLYLRKTLVSAHISIIPEFLDKLRMMNAEALVTQTKTEIVCRKNHSALYFRGIQSASSANEAKLKSIANVGSVILDEAQELDDEAAFDRIDLSLRSKAFRNRIVLSLNPLDRSHWIYRRFFRERGVESGFNGIVRDTCYIHSDYRDNAANLSTDFLQLAGECRERNPAKYRHIFLGMWRSVNPNALWQQERSIDPARVSSAPGEFDRIVVAVDPAVTAHTASDLTGIIVAAGRREADGVDHFYVLEDASLGASPDRWARAAVGCYRKWQADRIVAEVNNGGDLVAHTIRCVDADVPITAVRASRGKILRAEPVAALYEQCRVHHVGCFPELEEQLCSYSGRPEEKSPDRMDALVWAITALANGKSTPRFVLA